MIFFKIFIYLFFVFCPFRATPMAYGGSQARGSNRSYSCQPTPQQHQIRALSATYTTAHSNARSATHEARPGIEPTTSWFPGGFISAVPLQELLFCCCCCFNWSTVDAQRYLSGIEQSDSDIYLCVCVCVCVFFFRFFSLISYYKILNIVPCAIQ